MFSVIALWVIVKNFELIFENSFNENTCLTVILGDLNSLSLFWYGNGKTSFSRKWTTYLSIWTHSNHYDFRGTPKTGPAK